MRILPLTHRYTEWLMHVLQADPARNCYLLALVNARGSADISGPTGTLYGVFDDFGPIAAYWLGGSVVAVDATPETNRPIATLLNARGRWSTSFIGDSSWVLDLTDQLNWGDPRGVRPAQPLLVCEQEPEVFAHPGVRLGVAADFGPVFAASVEMFTEEVGFSPIEEGQREYRARVRSLLDHRSTLLVMSERGPDGGPIREWPAPGSWQQVIFKADLGIRSASAVQVQGVWTHPDFRGRGIASAAMVAVSAHAMQHVAPTASLYANSYNAPALRAYEKAGYVQRGTFATVMY
ncbi:DUF4081 domain-containing GNAT family N-acetyltransferase [Brevibacterium jeotgali]|uniref:GNAT family N-acetyltransferase n=1 Tax=Brevibacterium jeotgali TaxID=1262550 RepID=UPI001FEA07E4|nr:DUF4081 domain-containing GNAT family N-acetyltransferase [Brevibacterium jeotgali]